MGRRGRSENLTRAHLPKVLQIAVVALFIVSPIFGDDVPVPQRYVLNYPVAQQFCPPVDSYADDVAEAIQKVGGRTIRHQLNGGYGLPVIDMIGDQHVLHLGADVAWYRVGTPVYAIANGVVRVSQGPSAPLAAEKHPSSGGGTKTAEGAGKTVEISRPTLDGGDLPQNGNDTTDHKPPASAADPNDVPPNADRAAPTMEKPAGKKPGANLPPALGWGNIIVIEHHLLDGSYVTSIYGHLATSISGRQRRSSGRNGVFKLRPQ
jgi:hypothetical protein